MACWSMGLGMVALFGGDSGAQTFYIPPDLPPMVLTSGQTLHLGPGGELPGAFNALAGSTIHITGGGFTDSGGSRGDVYMNSGTLGTFFDAEAGSRIIVSGGSLGFGYDAFAGSYTLLSGGSAGPGLNLYAGAELTIVGTSFTIAGSPVPGLTDPWDELVVTQFNGARLQGSYLNGGEINFDLNSAVAPFFNARFHPGSTLRLVLALPGDFDRNGQVDLADYELWKEDLGQTLLTPGSGGDGNFDGVVDVADFTLWRNNLPSPLVGDYDRDGKVDQLDYLVWKNTFGTTLAAGTGADGNFDGVVDAADYTIWRNHLTDGQPAGLEGPPYMAVPEPPAVVLSLLAMALFWEKLIPRRRVTT